MTALEKTPKPSNERIRLAITTPSEVSANARIAMSPSALMTSANVSGTSAKRARISTRQPCRTATVVPPSTLPSSTVVRDSGETSTSRKKPNSRSQITEIADCTEVYITLSVTTAGKMNCRYVKGTTNVASP